MTPAQTLRAAKALISDPKNWITGEYANDIDGRCVSASHKQACMFCAVGALAHVAMMTPREVEQAKDFLPGVFLNKASTERNTWAPHHVNDQQGYEAVMAMYDRAIEMAEAAQ